MTAKSSNGSFEINASGFNLSLGYGYGLLVAYCPSDMLVYLIDRSARTVIRAATLRQKLHSNLLSHPFKVS